MTIKIRILLVVCSLAVAVSAGIIGYLVGNGNQPPPSGVLEVIVHEYGVPPDVEVTPVIPSDFHTDNL